METITLHIKNMVCLRCVSVIKNEVRKAGLKIWLVELGRVQITAPDSPLKFEALNKALKHHGFEILFSKEEQLVEDIKLTLIDYLKLIENGEQRLKTSIYLAERLNFNYDYLSKLFSNYENTTIEKYFILLKIERVKELLSYGEFTLGEIAYRLNYSSSQHLSNQFKQITGITVSEFKQKPYVHRHSFDKIG